ncbi:MAG TPA: FecR domain-containing protein [Candidatus Acidoferrum sp.]|nr:FecR domain-containing protein [Candidatus Acidoferrum sp.]
MKNIQMLAVLGMTLMLGGVAYAQEYTKPAAITVVRIQGEARYSVDGKAWHPLVVGKVLRAGTVIETASGSSADLVLSGNPVPISENTSAPQNLPMVSIAPDPNVRGYMAYKPEAQQNVIRMSGGTMLAVDQLTVFDTGADTVGNTEVDLRAGKIFFSVKKLSASSQYIIKLPNGVAGIRGATGFASADGSFGMLVGQAALSTIGRDGQPHVMVVNGGSGYDPGSGQVVPLSSQLLNVLAEFSDFAQTLVNQVSSQSRDLTCVYLSNNQGNNGQGQNNNNQGQNGGVVIVPR